jgi:hypothetical protein
MADVIMKIINSHLASKLGELMAWSYATPPALNRFIAVADGTSQTF